MSSRCRFGAEGRVGPGARQSVEQGSLYLHFSENFGGPDGAAEEPGSEHAYIREQVAEVDQVYESEVLKAVDIRIWHPSLMSWAFHRNVSPCLYQHQSVGLASRDVVSFVLETPNVALDEEVLVGKKL